MLLDGLQTETGLSQIPEGLSDDEVDPLLGLDLLLEHGRHQIPGAGAVRLPFPGGAEVPRHQGLVSRHLPADLGGLPVDLDGLVVPAHRGQLLAAPVEGHDLQHLGAGVEKLDVELPDGLGVIQDEVGREGTGRSVSPAFQFDDVATVTEDGSRGQPIQDVSIHDKTPFPFSFPSRARARKISTKSA